MDTMRMKDISKGPMNSGKVGYRILFNLGHQYETIEGSTTQ